MAGDDPFKLYPGICKTTEKNMENLSRVATYAKLATLLRAALTGLNIRPPWLTMGNFRQPLIGITALQIPEI
jgi:hypothetical protein